jgi:hypothetical protein
MNPAANAPLGRKSEGRLIVFFDKRYSLHADRFLDDNGCAPTQAVADLIRRYRAALPAAGLPPAKQWCSFRELRGAGPLAVQFASNTHKTIAAAFGGDLSALDFAAAGAGGVVEPGSGFDRRYRFQALSEVPIILNYNAADDLFPTQAHLLFHRAAQNLLEIRDLFTLGTYLTGRLIADYGHSGPLSRR